MYKLKMINNDNVDYVDRVCDRSSLPILTGAKPVPIRLDPYRFICTGTLLRTYCMHA